MHLVEDRKLDGDEGEFLELGVRHRAFAAVFEVEIKDRQAVTPITCETEKDDGV